MELLKQIASVLEEITASVETELYHYISYVAEKIPIVSLVCMFISLVIQSEKRTATSLVKLYAGAVQQYNVQ